MQANISQINFQINFQSFTFVFIENLIIDAIIS